MTGGRTESKNGASQKTQQSHSALPDDTPKKPLQPGKGLKEPPKNVGPEAVVKKPLTKDNPKQVALSSTSHTSLLLLRLFFYCKLSTFYFQQRAIITNCFPFSNFCRKKSEGFFKADGRSENFENWWQEKSKVTFDDPPKRLRKTMERTPKRWWWRYSSCHHSLCCPLSITKNLYSLPLQLCSFLCFRWRLWENVPH